MSDPDKAEGIAGDAWATNGLVLKSQLPDLETDGSDDAYRAYAKHTRVSVEWLRRKRPRGRSFGAFRVEIAGVPWGAVVLDSRSAKGIDEERFKTQYRMLAKFLSGLLKEARL